LDGESLERWLGELRADEAAAARRREGWLRRQEAEATTLAGLLRDFAEHATTVVVRTITGARHIGQVTTVAADFAAITTSANTVLLRERAIASIAAEPGSHAPMPSGDRQPLDRYFDDVVAALAGDNPRVVATYASGGVVSGELREVGSDVLGIATSAPTSRLTYVPLSALLELSLTGSG
jgi:hypothetical protein